MTTTLIMASAIYAPSSYLSSSTIRKSNYSTTLFSTSIALNPNAPNFSSSTLIPLLGFPHFSPWSGLKHLGISISRQSVKPESKEKCKGCVSASLFGVGAPEALVIGVVALLVFGPKGLAEVARNLGKTLREFQPTIRELQEVSNEFKSTLEREIGLDDIQSPKKDTLNSNTAKNTPRPAAISIPNSRITDESNGSPSQDKAYSTEDYLKITEEQLEATAAQQQENEQTASLTETQVESLTQPQDGLPSESKAYSSEDYLKITEEQLKATATQQQPKEQTASLGETQSESLTQPQVLVSDAVQEAAAVMPTTQKPESET